MTGYCWRRTRRGCTIPMTHSQGVFPLRNHLSLGLHLPVADIRCIHAEGSGCYGHNGADDVGLDAALLARAVAPRPVRLQWMRDDEFGWEPYGPAMIMRAKAALANGKIVEWNYELWSTPIRRARGSRAGTICSRAGISPRRKIQRRRE